MCQKIRHLFLTFKGIRSVKAQGRGTGLGLSQVYGFVKQSKGHVKLFCLAMESGP